MVCTKTEWRHCTVPICSARPGTCGIGGASSDGALEMQRLLHSVTKIPQLYRCELLRPGWEERIFTYVHGYYPSWGSEATPLATPFFKRAYKTSHPPGLWAFWDALRSFASLAQSARIGLSKWIFYVKNHPNLSDILFINIEQDFRSKFLLKGFLVTSILIFFNTIIMLDFRQGVKARQSNPGYL